MIAFTPQNNPPRRCADCHNLELQNKRLLENNRILTERIREGKRAAFKEVIQLAMQYKSYYNPIGDDVNQGRHVAMDDLHFHLEQLLSSQQEPQDN